jgi:hypothetical protein
MQLTPRPNLLRPRPAPLPPTKHPLHIPIKVISRLLNQPIIPHIIIPAPQISIEPLPRASHHNTPVQPRDQVLVLARAPPDNITIRQRRRRLFVLRNGDVRADSPHGHDLAGVLREEVGSVRVGGEDELAGEEGATGRGDGVVAGGVRGGGDGCDGGVGLEVDAGGDGLGEEVDDEFVGEEVAGGVGEAAFGAFYAG